MTFLVTGGTGFIGKRVVAQLLKRNIQVVATDINVDDEQSDFEKYLNSKSISSKGLELRELDMSSKDDIKNIFENYKFTNIIACGYQMSNLIDRNPIKGSEVNIVGMTNLFQSVLNYNIKRMVFPSSQSVYGTTSKLFNNQPVKEDDYCGLQHQLFTYAVMKLLNEFMAKKYIDLAIDLNSKIVIANNAAIAGHAIIDDYVILGGNCGVHQFTRIGKMAMVGGMTGVSRDVIPYGLSTGNRNVLNGINIVGLRRINTPNKDIICLTDAYKDIFKTSKH